MLNGRKQLARAGPVFSLPSGSLPMRYADLLDKQLNIEAAAAVLQDWSDRQRHLREPRKWAYLPEESKELYRLLVRHVAEALVNEDA